MSDGNGRRGGHRVNVWLPAELHETVRADLPDVNLSGVLQDALRELLGCTHEQLACAQCAVPIRRAAIVETALTKFYGDVMAAIGELVRKGGTAEGAARKVNEVATDWRVTVAYDTPLPRPTRAERTAAKVKEFPTPPRKSKRLDVGHDASRHLAAAVDELRPEHGAGAS